MDIPIPYNFTPRDYQMPFFRAMDNGKKRAILVWHRRSGKTKCLLNFAIKKAFERVGTYFHCFPEYGQGRKIVWDGIGKDGKPFLDHVPKQLRKSTNKTEMKVELANGSIYQIIGADNYDSLVGPNPVGLILDEWAVSDRYPMAWDYFRPILVENGGWAVFPYTPRGRNHGFREYAMALQNPEWFCQLLTVDDTSVVSKADIESERAAGMPEGMILQEFYCSFLASSEDIVIPFELIRGAMERDIENPSAKVIAGCDPARFGNDRTGFVVRQGGQVIQAEGWRNLDVTQVAGKLVNHFRNGVFQVVAVDVIGIGAGVFDIVKSQGVPAIAVNVAETPSTQPERFCRLRDQLWWKAREWFETMTCSISASIPKNKREALVTDIQDVHYTFDPHGRIKVESKEEMKKRLGKDPKREGVDTGRGFSPDIGDAFCLTFASGVNTVGSGWIPRRKRRAHNIPRPR